MLSFLVCNKDIHKYMKTQITFMKDFIWPSQNHDSFNDFIHFHFFIRLHLFKKMK